MRIRICGELENEGDEGYEGEDRRLWVELEGEGYVNLEIPDVGEEAIVRHQRTIISIDVDCDS